MSTMLQSCVCHVPGVSNLFSAQSCRTAPGDHCIRQGICLDLIYRDFNMFNCILWLFYELDLHFLWPFGQLLLSRWQATGGLRTTCWRPLPCANWLKGRVTMDTDKHTYSIFPECKGYTLWSGEGKTTTKQFVLSSSDTPWLGLKYERICAVLSYFAISHLISCKEKLHFRFQVSGWQTHVGDHQCAVSNKT